MQFTKKPETKGTGKFLRLEDQETVKGVFRGEPLEYYYTWNGKAKIPCSPDEEGARFGFRINFMTRENDALVAKIWEGGPTVYNLLQDLHAEYNLEETIVNIKRTGTKKDTSYTILPAKENKVAPDMEEQLKKVPLHDLTPRTPKEDNDTFP